jgi:RimJ/RimL family protein N-acetyltransferase
MDDTGLEIRLRPLKEEDSDVLFDWINDRELVTLSAPFREISWKSHDNWFRSVRKARDLRIFVIASEHDGAAVGYCQLKKIDDVNRNAELQIRIGKPEMRGRGIGTVAVRELLRFGFGALSLHRIYLHVFSSNVRAQRAYLKCGFSVEGLLRQAVCIEGRYEDVIIMGILSEQTRS